MRTRINRNLKRSLSICIVLALLLSTIGSHGTIAYAAEHDFEEVTLTLCSSIVDDDTIDLYLLESLHYILLDDLCRLTRSTKTVDGDIISVTQGMWRAEFDIASQTFYDGYQTVDITILEISKDNYAIPALMFLNYYKAIAWVENDVLYCEMPTCTAWEALDLDYGNSLVDIYELYGGEGNVELSLTLDILMDFIMGKNPSTEKYLKSAYYEALDVDIYSYDTVEQYVNERNEKVYNDLVAEETQSLLESLSSICETGDTTNKITQEAMDLYILFHCTGQTREFYNLAYNAMEIGDATSMRHYADQIASVWREGEFQKSLVKNNAKSVEGIFFLLSSAIEAAQQVKYVHQENNLVYRVMGQENMKKLALDVGDNEWYEVANVYKSTTTSLQNSFVNILEDLQTMAINDLVSEAAGKIGVDTFLESAASKATGIKGIKSASWKIGLEVGRGAVNLFSWIDSLAEPDSLVDILLTDVGAYEADRLALYLSELQQNVYWVLCHEYERLCNNWGDVNAYQDYIFAQQLYCRTSIAMYENLIAMNDEFGSNKDYWRSLFQNRIDMLAISLYQLTTLQDDGVNACLPLELSSFTTGNLSNASVSCYLPVIEAAIAATAYDSATGSGFLYDIDSDGVDELVILNVYAEVGGNSFPGHAYSVYDIENGEVIVKCDKEVLFYDAGGPSGYVGIVNYLGSTALVVYIDNGETGDQAQRESLYAIYNPDNLQVITSASIDYVSADPIQVNNCIVNGNPCSYNDYLSVVDAIEPIMIADIYSNDGTDGSMGLYELLRFIQELSGIKPEQSPKITKTDAGQIANSVWGEYLKREQGFDWKIFEEESLIKEGVEYYCYTLQTNSKYGATDWSVFYYLFINSVTGEYSNSLYDGFSQVNSTDPSETEQVESIPEIGSDTITEQELLGEWVIDTEYTMEFNDMSMWDFYGTSFSDGGNKMAFSSDGSYKYYVAWCYGNGTFELQNGEIAVNLTDGDPIQGAIKLFVMTDGVTRIALDQCGDGNLIFWIKS